MDFLSFVHVLIKKRGLYPNDSSITHYPEKVLFTEETDDIFATKLIYENRSKKAEELRKQIPDCSSLLVIDEAKKELGCIHFFTNVWMRCSNRTFSIRIDFALQKNRINVFIGEHIGSNLEKRTLNMLTPWSTEIDFLINRLIEEITEHPKLRLHLVTSGFQIHFDQ